MSVERFRDDPWARLPWVVPVALVLTVSSQVGFVALLQQGLSAPAPKPVVVQVLDLPATNAVPTPTPAPEAMPPVPRRERPQPARLEPPVAIPPSPPPSPEPERSSEPLRQQSAPELAKEAPSAASPPPQSTLPRSPEATAPSVPSPRSQPDPPAAAALAPHVASPGRPGGVDLGGGKMGARAIYKPLPEIPEALRYRNVEVVAVARFRVAASGAAEVDLVEPTSDPDLNRVLVESLKRWRFFPAMQDGKPVASTVDVRIPISVK